MLRYFALLIFATTSYAAAAEPSPTRVEVGRYVVVDTKENSTILVDTVTGKTWQLLHTIDANGRIGPVQWSVTPNPDAPNPTPSGHPPHP